MVRARELTRGLFRDQGPIPATRRFEWTVVALCTWLMAGAYLDAWAHRHLARLETFFTPWHAILYSGIFAILIFLGTRALRNQAHGHRLDQALPAGYNLSLIGAALFGVAGVIDMIWHLRFGIEVNLAALISPPHLLLMLAGTMIVAGPQRVVALRVGAFLGPVGVSALYLLFLALTRGIDWPITLWLGAIAVSGAIGVLLSYLTVHPPLPALDVAG